MGIATSSNSVWHSSDIDSPHVVLFEELEESLRRGNIDSALGLVYAFRQTLEPSRGGKRRSIYSELTDREWSTLVLLTDATLSRKDVARSLGITLNTLKTHLQSLYQKLGAHSRAEAIELGVLCG